MHIKHTGHGHRVHVGGRHRPVETKTTHPHLFKSVRDFLPAGQEELPAAPDTFNYFAASPTAQSDILKNDSLGDCTAAGACHLVESVTAAAGAPAVLTSADAVKFYSLATGYVDGDPSTDNGGDEVTVCTTWRDKGLDGNSAHAIVGWIVVDPTNEAEVKSCMYLFETLYFGIELDASWPSTVQGNGFLWDEGTPNPNEGHCVVGGGADTEGVLINSWGYLGKITYRAIAKFCADANGGNLFAVLTREILNRAQAKTPTGLDWNAVVKFFDSVGGTVTPDAPVDPNATPC